MGGGHNILGQNQDESMNQAPNSNFSINNGLLSDPTVKPFSINTPNLTSGNLQVQTLNHGLQNTPTGYPTGQVVSSFESNPGSSSNP